ncbi:MAG: DivIVA domain-containing protein [Actinomycetota bacterium]
MEMTPQTIRTTNFELVKKGYDPDAVDAFKEQVASVVEGAQNQATAMEARARAAVAKLQEVTSQPLPTAPSSSGDTEVISRTLLLAQRTADAAVAEARAEADQVLGAAREEAGRVLDSARSMAARSLDDAREEARRAVGDERMRAEAEVQALLARRDFLIADVEHLERFIMAQRERLRDAAVQLHDMVDRVPGGLADMRRPLLSASAEPLPAVVAPLPPDITGEVPRVRVEELPPLPSSYVAAPAPPPEVTRAEPAPTPAWKTLSDDDTAEEPAPDRTGEVPVLPTLKPLTLRLDDDSTQ